MPESFGNHVKQPKLLFTGINSRCNGNAFKLFQQQATTASDKKPNINWKRRNVYWLSKTLRSYNFKFGHDAEWLGNTTFLNPSPDDLIPHFNPSLFDLIPHSGFS